MRKNNGIKGVPARRNLSDRTSHGSLPQTGSLILFGRNIQLKDVPKEIRKKIAGKRMVVPDDILSKNKGVVSFPTSCFGFNKRDLKQITSEIIPIPKNYFQFFITNVRNPPLPQGAFLFAKMRFHANITPRNLIEFLTYNFNFIHYANH